jgi:hypothetical protein
VGWIIKELGFDSWLRERIFLSFINFAPALGHIQIPTELVPNAVSQEVKWQECETDHSLPSCSEIMIP